MKKYILLMMLFLQYQTALALIVIGKPSSIDEIKSAGIGYFEKVDNYTTKFVFLLCLNRERCNELLLKNEKYRYDVSDQIVFFSTVENSFEKGIEFDDTPVEASDLYPLPKNSISNLGYNDVPKFLKKNGDSFVESERFKKNDCDGKKLIVEIRKYPKSIFKVNKSKIKPCWTREEEKVIK